MAEMLEIRWHGRGGQGAKTAAILFAQASAAVGKFIQAFPEYGPERMGAPVVSYNRISDQPIRIHSGVEHPQIVAVLDASFVGTLDLTAGIPDGGCIVINSAASPAELRQKLGLENEQIKVFTVDANTISEETIGRVIPNTPMLGAIVGATGVLELDALIDDTRSKLEQKFRSKPEIIEGNLDAIRRAYQEVKGE